MLGAKKVQFLPFRLILNSTLRAFANAALQMFLLTYISYAALYSTRKPFSVVKTMMQNELNLTTYELGWIDTSFLASYALGQIFLPGMLAKAGVSSPVVLCWCYVGSGLVSALFGMSSSASSLILLWLINGILHAAVFPLLVASLTPWFSSAQRGQFMGSWTTSQQVGATISTAFSAFISRRWGFRSVFVIPALFVALVGLLLLKFLKSPSTSNTNVATTNNSAYAVDALEVGSGGFMSSVDSTMNNNKTDIIISPPAGTPQGEGDMSVVGRTTNIELKALTTSVKSPLSMLKGPPSAHLHPQQTFSFAYVLQIPDIRLVAASYFFVKCIRYSLLFWLPFYLSKHLNYDTRDAGYISILFDLGGLLGGLSTGMVSDIVFCGRRLFVASLMCVGAAAALMVFCFASNITVGALVISLLVIGFMVAGPDSLLGGTTAQDLVERSNSPLACLPYAAGIVNGMGSVGAVAQGYLTAHISAVYGWNALFATLCCFALTSVGLLVVPILHEYRPAVA